MVKIVQCTGSVTKLRTLLVEHPALVRELGFRLVEDPSQPYGFDVERTVPGARRRRRLQRMLDATMPDNLLAATVAALKPGAPVIGTTVSAHGNHLYSWARENHPKETIAHRFDPKRHPAGDPDGAHDDGG